MEAVPEVRPASELEQEEPESEAATTVDWDVASSGGLSEACCSHEQGAEVEKTMGWGVGRLGDLSKAFESSENPWAGGLVYLDRLCLGTTSVP